MNFHSSPSWDQPCSIPINLQQFNDMFNPPDPFWSAMAMMAQTSLAKPLNLIHDASQKCKFNSACVMHDRCFIMQEDNVQRKIHNI